MTPAAKSLRRGLDTPLCDSATENGVTSSLEASPESPRASAGVAGAEHPACSQDRPARSPVLPADWNGEMTSSSSPAAPHLRALSLTSEPCVSWSLTWRVPHARFLPSGHPHGTLHCRTTPTSVFSAPAALTSASQTGPKPSVMWGPVPWVSGGHWPSGPTLQMPPAKHGYCLFSYPALSSPTSLRRLRLRSAETRQGNVCRLSQPMAKGRDVTGRE